jgi:hypothetical protein
MHKNLKLPKMAKTLMFLKFQDLENISILSYLEIDKNDRFKHIKTVRNFKMKERSTIIKLIRNYHK